MKTGTVTWISFRNFGTYLQAYALQKALQNLGCDNKVIDDAKVVAAFPKKKFSPIRMLRSIPWLFPKRAEFNRRSAEAAALYEDFKNTCIDTDKSWSSREELASAYDTFIAGSDQIWSPTACFDDYYYLGFTDRKKVAYAPSLGTTVYPDDRVELARPFLEKFSNLSVREPQGAALLKEKFGLDAQVVADPTVLLTREDWDKLTTEQTSSEKPYALCYFLTYNQAYIDYAKEYCKRRGLAMKLLVVRHDFVGLGADEVYTGPVGFLNGVKGAEAVLTDSFHATIFSMIFEKQFYTFKRFKDGAVVSQNSRVENLLSKVGLSERLLDETSAVKDDAAIPYDEVHAAMSQMRSESLDYLKNALNLA